VAWLTLEEKLRAIMARLGAVERRCQDTVEYAERTNRIYHGLYQKHADRLAALERRLDGAS
jgi:hypothetical protein